MGVISQSCLTRALHSKGDAIVRVATSAVLFETSVQVFKTDHDVVTDGYGYEESRAQRSDRP